MDDKELVDKCWDDFIKNEITYSNELEHIGYEGIFRAGFEAAKRSQPSVVLPKPDHYYCDSDHYDAQDVHAALTAAGIKYTIGE